VSDLGKQIMSAVDDGIARMAAKESGDPRPDHYDDQRTTGFVVRWETHGTRKDGTPYTSVSWWYGDQGYWNAWGGLDSSVAWWPDKVKVKLALRRAGLASKPGVRIQTIADAKAELADQLEQSAGKLMARAVRLRGRP